MPPKPSNLVLVVEDERALSTAIAQKLEMHGCSAVTAVSVQQALDYLNDVPGIGAIWLDHYLLGDHDGISFVIRLKEHGSPWSSIPIFIVSNTASDEKRVEYLELGATRFYTKSEHRLEDIVVELESELRKHAREKPA